MRKPWFVLTPCGTSMWSNGATKAESDLLRRHANTIRPADVPAEDRALLEARLDRVRELILNADETTAQKQSAELNGILKLYAGQVAAGADHHVLLCTDTWMGSESGELAAAWLKGRGATTELYRQPHLRTDDAEGFHRALAEVVEWCHLRLPGERMQRRVIFNLTGGFKGVLTFLQALAPFYADESVYVFETGTLVRIPRLPIRLAADETIRANLTTLRRLGMKLSGESAGTIPETMLFQLAGEIELSEWGRLLWEQSREEIYAKELLPSPSPRIVYGPQFADTVRGLAPDRMIHINHKIDLLMRYLEAGKREENALKSLSFKRLAGNPSPPSDHEFYAWSDQGAWRVYCRYDGDTVILDRLGEHLR